MRVMGMDEVLLARMVVGAADPVELRKIFFLRLRLR
jgi:hypothetical protein